MSSAQRLHDLIYAKLESRRNQINENAAIAKANNLETVTESVSMEEPKFGSGSKPKEKQPKDKLSPQISGTKKEVVSP